MIKIHILLFSASYFLAGCSSCGPVTHLKKTLINIPNEVKTYQSSSPTANAIQLENGVKVTFSWVGGVKYESKNLLIDIWGNPKKIYAHFESDKLIELDAITFKQTNSFQIPKLVPMPYQTTDGYSVRVETESYLEATPKIFQIPKLIINGHPFILPEIKIMKATEELCFRPAI